MQSRFMWQSCPISSTSVHLRLASKLVKERKAMAWGGPPIGYQQSRLYSGQLMMPRPMPQRMMEEVRAPSKYPYQMNISIMSYNVLSDRLLHDNHYLYENTNPRFLEFSYRLNGILKNILTHKPTVVCLQEVDAIYFETDFMATLSRFDYEGEFIKRTGDDKSDGIAILYKKSELKRVDYQPIEYYVDGDRTLDRDNVGMVMALQPHKHVERRLPSRICVANTHLLYNPKRGDVKLAQFVYLLSHLDRMASKPSSAKAHYYPCFLCGDMNTVPFSPLYRFITTGYLNYSRLDKYNISGQKSMSDQRDVWISHNILPAFLSHECTLHSTSSADSVCHSSTKPTSADSCSNEDRAGREGNRNKLKPSASFKRSGDDSSSVSRLVKSAKSDLYAFPEIAKKLLEKEALGQSTLTSDGMESHNEPSRSAGEIASTSNSAQSTIDSGDKPSPVATSSPGSSGRSQPTRGADNSINNNNNSWGTLTHKFPFKSAYKHNAIARLYPQRVPEVTTQHLGNEGVVVDYIFYTGAQSREDRPSISLTKRLGLLSAQELAWAGNLPNAYESSDHLPLVAHFSVQK